MEAIAETLPAWATQPSLPKEQFINEVTSGPSQQKKQKWHGKRNLKRKSGFYWVLTTWGPEWSVHEWVQMRNRSYGGYWNTPGSDCCEYGDGTWLLKCVGPIEPPQK